jgi:rhamnogalacturonyl hydrolase YesR
VLGRAFRSTGKIQYVALLTEFLESFTTLQSNNLWWHCKASPYFWGRGNAFAALGFAEAMTYLPINHPSRSKLMQTHLQHLEGLVTHQDESGMWRQVIDRPETYLEHSATSMIGCSIARGIRRHWLSDAWRPTVERAWDAVSQRIGEDGSIKQVCVGTGPLGSLEEYIKRPYTDGVDERGGAMALWFAAEMVRMQSEN